MQREPLASPGGWWRVLWNFGFPMLFGLIALGYGLWFGTQLVETQRSGIEAITRIETYEAEQTYQLRTLEERLYRIEVAVRSGGAD